MELHEEQPPPPPEPVNFPPLREPKTENFFSALPAPQAGQAGAGAEAVTSFSNSRPQRRHRNS